MSGAPAGGPGRCTVTVCRGCCCGTLAKHPGIDHDAHMYRLRRLTPDAGATVKVADCLDNCDNSNTVVVSPSRLGRASGGQVTWFGRVLDDTAVDAIAQWVEEGGPGLVAMPKALEPLRQQRPRAATTAS
jgi:hypothetical protein